MHRDVHQHISTCQLCIHFLPSKVHTQPLHLEIPLLLFTGCHGLHWAPGNHIKGHRHAWTFICLLPSYLITVPLKIKPVDKVSMAHMKKVLPKMPCSKFILQDNGTQFKNEQLMSIFDSSDITCIYSNLYHPNSNSRIENVHHFLKHTIAKFTYGNQLEWDDVLPLATYCYNISPSVDDLELPFYLVHGTDPLEDRFSNSQNYCRYLSDQSEGVAVQELRKL